MFFALWKTMVIIPEFTLCNKCQEITARPLYTTEWEYTQQPSHEKSLREDTLLNYSWNCSQWNPTWKVDWQSNHSKKDSRGFLLVQNETSTLNRRVNCFKAIHPELKGEFDTLHRLTGTNLFESIETFTLAILRVDNLATGSSGFSLVFWAKWFSLQDISRAALVRRIYKSVKSLSYKPSCTKVNLRGHTIDQSPLSSARQLFTYAHIKHWTRIIHNQAETYISKYLDQ